MEQEKAMQGTVVYHFVGDDGENIVIAVDPLREWCRRTEVPIREYGLSPEMVQRYRVEDQAIN
jgi:hypothetical protein